MLIVKIFSLEFFADHFHCSDSKLKKEAPLRLLEFYEADCSFLLTSTLPSSRFTDTIKLDFQGVCMSNDRWKTVFGCFKQLEELYLDQCQIDDLKILSVDSLKSLKVLMIDNGRKDDKLFSLTGISYCTALRYLIVESNLLEDMSDLEACQNLEELDIENCKSIRGFDFNLPKLKHFRCVEATKLCFVGPLLDKNCLIKCDGLDTTKINEQLKEKVKRQCKKSEEDD